MKKSNLHSKIIAMSYTIVGILCLAASASGETNISEKVVQLKENVSSSKENLKQYEDNLKIVDQNIKETQSALKQLEKQKLAIRKQLEDSQKGKSGVESSKKQVQGFMKSEQDKMDLEKKQLEDLKASLAKLEANQLKRAENITAYQAKLQSMEAEQGNWQNHHQEIVDLEKALLEKLGQAQKDQKALNEKKVSYEQEVTKWKKQQRLSERNYANFKDLKDE